MRRFALALVAAGCVPASDFAGTEYRCDESPTCPDGFECAAGACVPIGGGAPADSVTIPAGSVFMGCDPGESCPADAQPLHEVEVAAFSIDPTEVSEEEYAACVADGACVAPDDFAPADTPRSPVRGVSWSVAGDYCRWRGARLPTEAEWERAARGSDRRRFPWGDDAPDCDRAALAGCGEAPVAVGELDGVGPFGAADLVGNVAEWVADWYQSDYYDLAPAANPAGPAAGGERVLRGGSYLDDPAGASTWARRHADPLHGFPDVGFRCAE